MKCEVFMVYIFINGQYQPAYKTQTYEQAKAIGVQFEQYRIVKLVDEIIDL